MTNVLNTDLVIKKKLENVWNGFLVSLNKGNPYKFWMPAMRDLLRTREKWLQLFRYDCSTIYNINIYSGVGGSFSVGLKEFEKKIGFTVIKNEVFLTSVKTINLINTISEFDSIESDNFIFYYRKSFPFKDCHIAKSEKLYKLLTNNFELDIEKELIRKEKIKYVLLKDKNQIENIIGIHLDQNSSLTDTISLSIISTRCPDTHEIAHAVITKHVGGTPPLVYREGLAECFIRPTEWKRFIKSPFSVTSVFASLDSEKFFCCSTPWAQAGCFCKYLLKVYGIEFLKEIHKKTRTDNYMSYIRKKTGRDVIDLYNDARELITRRPYVFNRFEIITDR
jgi:hypothetical protein